MRVKFCGKPSGLIIPVKIAPHSDRRTHLEVLTEESAKTPYIECEGVIIKFALPRVMRLLVPAIPRHVTRKPTLFYSRTGWEYNGDVEVDDGIH
jgi:hypothetical protein